MSGELHTLGVAELGRQLAGKAVSSVEVTQSFLARAKADTHGAFLVVDEQSPQEADSGIHWATISRVRSITSATLLIGGPSHDRRAD